MNEPQNSLEKSKPWFAKFIARLTGKPVNVDDLQAILQYASTHELIDNDTLNMLEGVLHVQELRVEDAMVPRSQMVLVHYAMPSQEIIDIIIKSGHSRFPVISDTKDEILGILLAKDLLQYANQNNSAKFKIREILRPAIFIPANKRLDSLLEDFQTNKNHMAIVVDEYGGITGLITIEDVLEQIVGNIEDEHDKPDSPNIRKHGNHIYSIKGITALEEFNKFFNTDFTNDNVDTIGGLVAQHLGYLPKHGETLEIAGITFKILKADTRRIYWLQVIISDDTAKEIND